VQLSGEPLRPSQPREISRQQEIRAAAVGSPDGVANGDEVANSEEVEIQSVLFLLLLLLPS